VHTLDIAPLRNESPPQKRSGMARVLKGFHSFTCTPTRSSAIGMSHTCLMPLPSQPQLVLIYRPRRDGRLSRPLCEIAQAEIRTRNLPIANPALYYTAASAPRYLTDPFTLAADVPGRPSVRSSSRGVFIVPRTSRKFGDRAYSVAAPRAWNRLPMELRHLRSTPLFKCKLKTFLFADELQN